MSHSPAFKPLSQTNISSAGCYVQETFGPPPVSADSPAVQVMTDLSKVPAATITLDSALEEANQSMILRGVRLLLVVEKDSKGKKIAGIITSVDILGEKPVLVAQSRRVKRSDLRVDDVMVPVKAMEALNISDVDKTSVGNIVATLKAAGRAHALVIKEDDDGMQSLVGIFSASQIARQLGVQVLTHEMARTFAEIEAVIAGL